MIIKCLKFVKSFSVTPKIFAVSAPSWDAKIPLKLLTDIINANKLPSTPSLHLFAV